MADGIGQIAVCSWSLGPSGPDDLVEKLAACGINAVQLALDPIRRRDWDENRTTDAFKHAGITIVSGMMTTMGEDYSTLESIKQTGGVRPDETWEENLAAAKDNAQLARRLGLNLITLHAGFLPHAKDDPIRRVMLDRLSRIAAVFGEAGVQVGFETGQESAETLLGVLDELHALQDPTHPRIGVNFDPANMILYGMGDPIEALSQLANHVVQIHIKDALPTTTPGTWGSEVPAGQGNVDWNAFFRVYQQAGLGCDLVIEREAGTTRVDDIRHAVDLIRSLMQDKH